MNNDVYLILYNTVKMSLYSQKSGQLLTFLERQKMLYLAAWKHSDMSNDALNELD